jgi:hypothetical protein
MLSHCWFSDMMIVGPSFKWAPRVVVLLAVSSMPASAQSAIAGTVRDLTGAVLPGVTVEASSPALIERTRSAVTDGQGQYRLIDLRPGTYAVTFTLAGFSGHRHEGLELPANFTAPLNATLSVGALAETVTVTGASPLVDVQTTARRQSVDQERLDSLPTARDFQSVGVTVPGVVMGWGADVGGSKSMLQGAVFAYGGRGTDQSLEVDGQNVMGALANGAYTLTYPNQGEFKEMVYQVAGGAADTQSAGIQINMIPKEGGNQFKGSLLGLYSRTGFQANNITDALRAKGFTTPERLARMWDLNGDVGGPIKRDRIWFYTSYRNWSYDTYIGNIFFPDGRPAIDSGLLQALSTRLTLHPSSRDKITFAEGLYPKFRNYHLINSGTQTPAGSPTFDQFVPTITQAKWTSTPTAKVLVEVGSVYQHYRFDYAYQPDARKATCFTAYAACPPGTDYGAITHRNLLTGITDVAYGFPNRAFVPKTGVNASVSYVTGTHTLKVGTRLQWGHYEISNYKNGDLIQNYRGSVPDSVDVANTPVLSNDRMNRDLGVYVQDSWTIKRLTLNPGLRFEQLIQSTAAVDSPAGRFVPARHFDAIQNLPHWQDFAPRFGAAYDLRGNGKTAIKGSVGKYMQQDQTNFALTYDPSISSTDRRTWRDLNGDDVAQENEIGPPQNLTFGIRRNRNPAADIKRPFQVLANVGISQQLREGLALSVDYYRRSYHQLFWRRDLGIPPERFAIDYTPVTIADPRGNGQTITVYNLNPALLGLVNEVDDNSANNWEKFNAVDVTFNARLRNEAVLSGGVSTGKLHKFACDVQDPNMLRGCEVNFPFRTQYKLSGSYPLAYGFRLNGVFQSLPGQPETRLGTVDGDLNIIYLVNRTIVPTLTQSQVSIRLNTPGTEFLDRVNLLDLSLTRTFPVGRVQLKPQLDVFNVLNGSPATDAIQTWGPSVYLPRTVLAGRLMRLNLRVEW